MTGSGEVWVQIERNGKTFECFCFSGVPAARPSWIVLVSNGSEDSRKYAGELGQELEAILLGSSPEVIRKDMQCPGEPRDMMADQHRARRKVLVLVASADAKFADESWYQQWQSDENDAAVMTVLPRAGEFEKMFADSILKDETNPVSRVNASWWEGKVAESAQAVLARADVTTGSSRVFISYRRIETLNLALQLFDALTHAGFEVFLDRFSIPAGYDFQRRLFQELEDKSMVLLLESRSLKNSKWTQREIDFAKKNRLGLLALKMPDVTRKDQIVSVRPDARVALRGRRDFEARPVWVKDASDGSDLRQWSRLRDDALERVVAAVQRAHTDALFFRRRVLRLDIVAALRKEGIPMQVDAIGPVLAGNSPLEHLLWLTPRPPEVEDFRSVHRAHETRLKDKVVSDDARGIIVGPQAQLEPDRAARLRWLGDVSGVLSFDEGDLASLAKKIKAGVWS